MYLDIIKRINTVTLEVEMSCGIYFLYFFGGKLVILYIAEPCSVLKMGTLTKNTKEPFLQSNLCEKTSWETHVPLNLLNTFLMAIFLQCKKLCCVHLILRHGLYFRVCHLKQRMGYFILKENHKVKSYTKCIYPCKTLRD